MKLTARLSRPISTYTFCSLDEDPNLFQPPRLLRSKSRMRCSTVLVELSSLLPNDMHRNARPCQSAKTSRVSRGQNTRKVYLLIVDVDALLDAEKAQHELVFLQLVSVFVGAIRCSVLDVEQAREPLSHYGRFGPTYDAIVKKLVDPLRDEGIYNNEATTVQHIAAASLTSVIYFHVSSYVAKG